MKNFSLFFCFLILLACKKQSEKTTINSEGTPLEIKYASGFNITAYDGFKIIEVNTPWPKAEKSFTYLLVEDKNKVPENIEYDEKVTIPIKNIVVTSTTHIPSLETLQEENSLIGFPNLDYISSKKTRKLINENKIRELGENEDINTEVLLELDPEVVIGFAIKSGNKTFNTIQKSGIPVLYNADWTEENPLGKAEWIKFFGALYGKDKLAKQTFDTIESEYNKAKKIAKKAQNKPTILSGAMYKDVWYLPGGNSWQAKLLKDANTNYLYSDNNEKGSLSLSFESVLEKAKNADFWMAPGSFTTYQQLEDASAHYKRFKAFENKKMFTYAGVKGETGGVLFYELAPNRPDLVLKDLVKIFHPELLQDYETVFLKPLK